MAFVSRKKIHKFINPYRITDGKSFRLKQVNPNDTHGLESEFKDEAKVLLARGIERLAELQELLYASDRWGVLLIFQAMDAAGKDVVAAAIVDALEGLDLSFPEVDEAQRAELAAAREMLLKRVSISLN